MDIYGGNKLMNCILDNIADIENPELEDIVLLKASNLPIFLYGNGSTAKRLLEEMDKFSISIKGIIVSDEYYNKENFEGYKVYSLSQIVDMGQKINIIIGYKWSKFSEITVRLSELTFVHNIFLWNGNDYIFNGGPKISKLKCMDLYPYQFRYRGITYQFIKNNIDKFMETYEWLEDDLSKKTMLCYLKGHANQTALSMKDVCLPLQEQYFTKDIISFGKNEVFVDCGAYSGDNIVPFVKKVSGVYDKIYALEPDRRMVTQLSNNTKNYDCIEILKVGAYDKEGMLSFLEDNGCGEIVEDDSIELKSVVSIETKKIDNIVGNDKVTYIKMDIEGAELKALWGARDTICNNRPKLAISVYHKGKDLIEIPQYLKSLVPEYKFYLRAYLEYLGEVVLYAVL